jgi:hypothetical protein
MSKFLPFDEAKSFVHELKIKSSREWLVYCKSGNKPKNIPSTPDRLYKGKGWVSWGDWFNNGVIAPSKIPFIPFSEAREFVRSLKFKNQNEWYAYHKTNKPNIPSTPNKTYKEWVSWGDWLGNGIIARKHIKYISFDDAKKVVSENGIKTHKEYRAFAKNHIYIPSDPSRFYKDKWRDWYDWISEPKYLPLNEALKLVRKLKFRNEAEYKRYVKKHPESKLPYYPERIYGNNC